MSERKIENEMNLTASELRREYSEAIRVIHEVAAERDELRARVSELEAAIKLLLDYETTGAPAFLNWDKRFEALREAYERRDTATGEGE